METIDIVKVLAKEMNITEIEFLSLAMQTGIKELWRNRMIEQHLKGLITRSAAIENCGISYVELAEKQKEAVLEDIQWAMK